ncbi:MAG: 3-hydroxyisobutyrate dehydrogenase, partial [Pseudomonadota bacterium]
MAKVTVIGLGNMGRPMALNLQKAGNETLGWDLVAAARDRYTSEGGRIANGLEGALKDADAVVSMIPAGPDVHVAYLGDNGILSHASKETLLIDSSTIDVDTSRAVNQAATEAGYMMVDAPVSGAQPAAIAGTLTFMVGGTDEAFAKAKPVLEGMGTNVIHAGPAGSGQAAKICNNMLAGTNMAVLCEALHLGQGLGLDPKVMFEIINKSSGQSWALTSYCPVAGPVPAAASNRNFEPGFATALMTKDMTLSQQAAQSAGVSTPLAAQARAMYQLLVNSGYADKDFSVIYEFLAGQKK